MEREIADSMFPQSTQAPLCNNCGRNTVVNNIWSMSSFFKRSGSFLSPLAYSKGNSPRNSTIVSILSTALSSVPASSFLGVSTVGGCGSVAVNSLGNGTFLDPLELTTLSIPTGYKTSGRSTLLLSLNLSTVSIRKLVPKKKSRMKRRNRNLKDPPKKRINERDSWRVARFARTAYS